MFPLPFCCSFQLGCSFFCCWFSCSAKTWKKWNIFKMHLYRCHSCLWSDEMLKLCWHRFMCIGLFMATDSSCSIKRIKEVNYISKYLKTHSTHQVSDLSIIKHLFLHCVYKKRENQQCCFMCSRIYWACEMKNLVCIAIRVCVCRSNVSLPWSRICHVCHVYLSS